MTDRHGEKDRSVTRRRDFLKLAGLSPAAMAAVVVGGKADEAKADTPDSRTARLQDTPHTRAYFESTRF